MSDKKIWEWIDSLPDGPDKNITIPFPYGSGKPKPFGWDNPESYRIGQRPSFCNCSDRIKCKWACGGKQKSRYK